MAQSNATIYIKPNTLTSLNVVAITDEGTLNLSLSDFVQSSIPSGVYLAYTASDFNRIKSVTVSSPGYKTATWSTTDTHLTDVYITLEEVPNPVIREISVGGVVYDIDTKGGSGSGRNVGDIFYTTRTDSGLGGAVECNGGTYSTADYTGTGSIGELLASGKLPYVSLADYATQITNNGVCGVFGWDGTGTTAFRVPTLKDMFIECGQASQLGNYIPAGLPNITGSIQVGSGDIASGKGMAVARQGTRSLYGSGTKQKNTAASNTATVDHLYPNINFDASRSSSIYGNSTTVQPKAIKYRAMVQLFNTTTDEAIATVGTVVAQVGELNTHKVVDFQIPTASNGYTWYRKYADGWVEQGGIMTSSYNPVIPVEMADTNYTLVCVPHHNANAQVYWADFGHTKTTTGFTRRTNYLMDWFVSGMAA